MIIFGLVQALGSQIPDFRSTVWLSIVSAIMSVTYSLIGSGLSLAKIIGKLYAPRNLYNSIITVSRYRKDNNL